MPVAGPGARGTASRIVLTDARAKGIWMRSCVWLLKGQEPRPLPKLTYLRALATSGLEASHPTPSCGCGLAAEGSEAELLAVGFANTGLTLGGL